MFAFILTHLVQWSHVEFHTTLSLPYPETDAYIGINWFVNTSCIKADLRKLHDEVFQLGFALNDWAPWAAYNNLHTSNAQRRNYRQKIKQN